MEPLISRYQFLIVEECGVCINEVVCEINKLTGSMAPAVEIPNFDPRFCNLGLVLRCSTQGFPINLVETIGNGSLELPSNQNILLCTIAPWGASKCKKV